MSSDNQNNQSKVNYQKLDNGITLITVNNPAADIISGRFFFSNCGSIVEPLHQSGISNLVSSVIVKGTKNYSALDIADRVESIGASLGADGGTDYFALSLKTVSVDFAPMLELIGEIIQFPTFPDSEVELERKITLQSIRSQKEQPFNVAFHQLRQNMYGDHPYGQSILGTKESVSQLSVEDLHNYHQQYFRPDNMIVSISGRIDEQETFDLVNKTFGNWQPHQQSSQATANVIPKIETKPSHQVITQDTQQSIVILGYQCVAVDDPAYSVLKLLSTYLGNGLSSRLFVELREKRGLAYDISAFFPTRLEPAPFIVYMGTAPENTDIAIEGLSQEVARLSEVKLSDTELQGAKNKFLGQYALGKQTNGAIAQTYGWYESLGLGIDFDLDFPQAIAQVTAEKAQATAQKYLQDPFISIVKPEA